MSMQIVNEVQLPGKEGRAGAIISKAELLIFYNLHHLRVMDSPMIRKMYSDLVYNSKNPSQVITNRLVRLVQRNVLIKEKAATISDSAYGMRHYRLSALGYQALVDAGLIEQELVASSQRASFLYVNRDPHSKQNGQLSVHTATVVNFVSKVVMEWYKQHGLTPLQYFRGARGESIIGHAFSDYAIIPDYIFVNDNRIVFLENDTGTQSISVLNQKLERYKRLVEAINLSYPEQNYQFNIVFSVVDKTVYPNSKSNAASRVATVRGSSFPVKAWPNNMRPFIDTAENSVHLITNLLNGTDISSDEDKDRAISNMITFLNINLAKEETKYIVKEIEGPGFLKRYLNGWERLPRMITITANGEQRILLVTYIEPGDIRDYYKAYRVDRILNAFERDNIAFSIPTGIYNVYLYRHSEKMINDNVRVDSPVETRFLSLEDLKFNWNNNFDFEWYSMRTKRTKTMEKGFFI